MKASPSAYSILEHLAKAGEALKREKAGSR
jgi:hypothetical protein